MFQDILFPIKDFNEMRGSLLCQLISIPQTRSQGRSLKARSLQYLNFQSVDETILRQVKFETWIWFKAGEG
jgi:hypothetical protein